MIVVFSEITGSGDRQLRKVDLPFFPTRNDYVEIDSRYYSVYKVIHRIDDGITDVQLSRMA